MNKELLNEEVKLYYRTYYGEFRPFDFGSVIVGRARSKTYIKVIDFEGVDLAEAAKDFKEQVDEVLDGKG